MDTKICSKCGEEKTLDLFVKNSNRCKVCKAKHHKKYDEENKEKIAIRRAKYHQKNKIAAKNWRKKNKAHIQERNRIQRKQMRADLGNKYIIKALQKQIKGLPKEYITEEIIDLKRKQLQLYRIFKSKLKNKNHATS